MLKPLSTSAAQATYQCYQQAATPAARQDALAELLTTHVVPLVQIILSQKLSAQAASDDRREVQQQIHAKLLARLRATEEAPLQDFAGYVAVVAFNTCAEWQRQRQPQRHALKNRVRYLLTHTAGLAVWEAQPRGWWCGQSAWRTHTHSATAAELAACRHGLSASSGLRELTATVFARLGQPVELNELVNLLADVLDIHDVPAQMPDADTLADPRPSVETTAARRAYLQRLWAEITALPLNQRAALLLNLRDPEGGNQLAFFHLTGVAGLGALAQALELGVDAFLELWNRLPLDDLTLAARLGVTRQQVINLRLAARRRLARRLGAA